MLKVGITGGIGSGKSTVCQVFKTLGIPVFFADAAAKYLMDTDEKLISSIKAIFGDDIYKNDHLDRPALSSIVFKQPELLQKLNDIVHPATIAYGNRWMASQNTPYVLKEAAIFFESGTYKDMDVMIGVYAPQELRIRRAMTRDGATREKIEARIAQQMNEDEKMAKCNYVIYNDDEHAVIPQVEQLHEQLLSV